MRVKAFRRKCDVGLTLPHDQDRRGRNPTRVVVRVLPYTVDGRVGLRNVLSKRTLNPAVGYHGHLNLAHAGLTGNVQGSLAAGIAFQGNGGERASP